MKKNNILIICTLVISSLIIGCSDKSIMLNANTKVEQSYFNSNSILKEKEFKLNNARGESFEPSFIGIDGLYGLTYIKNEKKYDEKIYTDNIVKRVLEDGTIENTKENLETDEKGIIRNNILPYELKRKNKSELIYKDNFIGSEKILTCEIPTSKLKEELIEEFNEVLYVVENSPYVVILETSNNRIGEFDKTINIVNLITGEEFKENNYYWKREGPKENNIKFQGVYFYGGEEGVIYSLSYYDGSIKKISFENGSIEEEEYDKIVNSQSISGDRYEIYTNGLETRIIGTVQGTYGNLVEKQFAYKVTTKEYEVLYDSKSKQGKIINKFEMLPNNYMISKINKEYVLIKFDANGIKLVDKFNFSDVVNSEYENIRDIKVATNKNGSEILIKIIIANSNTNEFTEKFKMYEIETK